MQIIRHEFTRRSCYLAHKHELCIIGSNQDEAPGQAQIGQMGGHDQIDAGDAICRRRNDYHAYLASEILARLPDKVYVGCRSSNTDPVRIRIEPDQAYTRFAGPLLELENMHRGLRRNSDE